MIEQRASRQQSRDDVRMQAHAGSQTQPHNEPAAPVEDPFDLTGIEEQLDPKFLRYLKAMKSELDSYKEMKTEVQGFKQREQARDQMSNAQLFDAAFAAMPEKFRTIFGEGEAGDFGPENQSEMQCRVAVLTAALGNKDVRSLTRRQLQVAMNNAAEMLFGKLVAPGGQAAPAAAHDPYAAAMQQQVPRPPARKAPSVPPRSANRAMPSEEEWLGATLAQPTQRRGGSEPNGRAKAIRSVQEIMRQGGDGATDAEIDEGLLE
jgi:hypothetical protein